MLCINTRLYRAVWAYKKAAPEQLRDVEIAGHKLYSVTDERILKDWHVDYTDQVPSCGAVFPQGLQEIERRTYITGAVCVTNQSNFGLYFTFAKSAGDDEGAKINADWVNDFQHWVQEQSTHGLAPNFGDAEESVIARAQNGVLYEAEAEGTATYMVVLSLRYTKTYESEDFA